MPSPLEKYFSVLNWVTKMAEIGLFEKRRKCISPNKNGGETHIEQVRSKDNVTKWSEKFSIDEG